MAMPARGDMLLDARRLPPDATLHAEVCVVGGGPAGITTARELSRHGVRVCLLESGGLKPSWDASARAEWTPDGPTRGLSRLGRRQLGGWANTWAVRLAFRRPGVRHAPLTPVDFETRPELSRSGWPMTYDDLLPYYHRAQQLCRLGPFAYEAADWEAAAAVRLPLDPSTVVTRVYQFGERSAFTSAARRALGRDRGVTTVLHGTALRLETEFDPATVSHVTAASEPGRRFAVAARAFVLAAGAIENPRLLLLSQGGTDEGLGNEHGLVGRYLLEHPVLRAGELWPSSRELFNRAGLYDLRERSGVHVMGHLALAEPAMRREGLRSYGFWLFPRPSKQRLRALATVEDVLLRRFDFRVRGKELGPLLAEAGYLTPALLRLLTRGQPLIPGDAWGGWSSDPRRAERLEQLEVAQIAEQSPDPENRVLLGSRRDAHGRPVAELHWSWGADDAARAHRAATLLAEAFERSGLGRLEPPAELPVANLSHHLMGTTRMHADVRHGVVDSNCRVHGLGNLFVAGSSVFPTGGYANPTLTIVALAARLADRIAGLLSAREPVLAGARGGGTGEASP